MRNHLLKSIFVSLILAMGINNAWAYTAHFSLMGDPIGNWNNDRDFMINTGTGTTDEWYIYAYVANNQYFALNNGSSQYGPESNGKEIKQNTGGGQGKYNTNSWKFTGTNGIIKICCAESQNREWYPWVWVEESAPTIKFKHPWNGGNWSEQTATKQNDGTYTYDGKYGNNNGFNAGPSGNFKYNTAKTTVEGSPAKGDLCRFIWNPVGYVQGGAEDKASGTFKIVKLCSLTYNGNGNTGGTIPSATDNQLYNTSITLSSTTLTKVGYTHTGWNTKSDGTGTHYNKGASYTLTAISATLYAEWTENTYTITISAGTGGAVSPSGSQTIGQVTQTTVTATPNDNYEFANWTVTGGVVVANTSSASTTITATAAGTLTANFRSTATNSLTVVAGANIESVSGSTDPITLGNTYEIKATPKTGYTFSTWTANPAENATFGSATTAETTVTVNNGSVTVTASATEIMSTLTTSNKYNAGDPDYKIPAASVNSIGYETTATVTATAAGNGYTFTGWTLSNCTRTDGGAADATSITVRSNGDSKAAMVTANYEEDLATTKWYISGNGNGSGNDLTPGSPFTGWATNGIQMFKKSGNSTEEIYYCTITANTIASSDDHFPFKVYNATTSKYWGNNGYWVTKENNHPTLSSNSGDNMKFRPYLTGTYEFKLDATNASSPVLTVTWPVYNQLRISEANPADATNTGEFDMTGSGTYTVTRSLKANTKYTFKIVYDSEWYGASSGNLTRALSTKTLSTSSDDLTIETDIAGDYTFNFNASTRELSVVYPVSEYEYYISGSVNNWAPNDNEYGMTEISTNVYAITVTLPAGDHTFKVHQLAGDWYGWDYIEDKDIIELSNEDSNIKLTLTNTTDVTIKFDSNTKKISFEGLTAVTYTDITVQLYTEESAPQIWWWGSDGEQSKDAADTYNYDTSAPTMNAVAGEDNWYEWTIEDVATHSGVIVRFKNSSTQSADYTVYENTCFDGRDLANTRTTTCGEVPTTCLDCSGIYLKGTFNEWLPDNEFKKTSDPNVVTLSINLTKGNHEFKIHGDEWYGNTGNLTRENTEQAWTYNKDEDKTPFRVDVAGDYKFSWNISEHKLTVTYPEFPVISNQPEKIYFLPNTSWKTADATFAAFFLDGDKGTAAKWVAFTDADGDGMYELTNDKKYLTVIFCRMNPNGTDTDNWKNKWNQSADITIPNASYLNCWIDDSDTWDDATGTWAMPLSSGDNSAAITAAAEAGQTVTALVNRSFTQGDGWYTLALPFNMNAALIGEAYQLSGLVRKTGEYVEVNLEKTSTISAGQPYLILPNENKSYLLVDNVTIKTTETSITKSISGLSVSMQAIINGANEQTTTEYWVGNSGMLYNTPTKKLGLRALFNITSSSGIAPRMRVVAGENVETGVEDIITTDAPVKVIENGQLIIIRGGEKYNVQGVRLNQAS